MAAETTNGVPYLELADSPDLATATLGIAGWLEDELGAGTTQQVLTADQAAAHKLAFKYPKARTAAPTPTGELGALWTPTSGADSGKLHHHNGTAFERVTPDLAYVPLGLVAGPATTAAWTAIGVGSWTDVSGLSLSVALSTARKYVVEVQAAFRALYNGTDPYIFAAGRIMVGATDYGRYAGWTVPVTSTVNPSHLFCGRTPAFAGPGGTVTVKAQAYRLNSHSLNAGGEVNDYGQAFIQVFDVGKV